MNDDHTDQQAMSEALQRGEQFTRIFVGPMIEAMNKRLDDHVTQMKAALEPVGRFEGRISKLEANQKRALWGWGVFASAISGAVIFGYGWVKGHINVKIG